eukprot:GHVT01045429.1.p1 GENE.GHVT01045429.1~~GHVT01045429.1.p1  ORF type:complete len:100 (-),score=0.50 GHVT01045429.1:136-435(-)
MTNVSILRFLRKKNGLLKTPFDCLTEKSWFTNTALFMPKNAILYLEADSYYVFQAFDAFDTEDREALNPTAFAHALETAGIALPKKLLLQIINIFDGEG